MKEILNHTTFGGVICLSDFETNHRGSRTANGSPIARRIIADWSFDDQCRKNTTNNIKKWRNI